MSTTSENARSTDPAGDGGKGLATTDSGDRTPDPETSARALEIGGREGPEPTRYGDWEKNGRCIDF